MVQAQFHIPKVTSEKWSLPDKRIQFVTLIIIPNNQYYEVIVI